MMETIRIKCPQCSAILETQDNPAHYEKNVTCPNCKTKNRFKDFKRVAPRVQEDDSTQIEALKQGTTGHLLDISNGREYPLNEGRNLVGRKPLNSPPKADIAIITNDRFMSREHLSLDVMKGRDGRYHVYASNAKNQNETLINGETLESGDKVGLKHGDILKLGETSLKYIGFVMDDATVL